MNIRADETIYFGATSRFENSCLPLFIRVSDPTPSRKKNPDPGPTFQMEKLDPDPILEKKKPGSRFEP